MKRYLPFSDESILERYIQLIKLLSNAQNRISATRTLVRTKLVNRRVLLRHFAKFLKSGWLTKVQSYLISAHCLLKRYLFCYFPSFFQLFDARSIAFFIYHFISLYQAIFLLKMILEWFPIKNWDRAQPLIRFLRRVTDWWTRKFDEYVPSAVAWIIVINIVPLLLLFLGNYYKWYDLSSFPTTYTSADYFKFLLLTQSW